MAELKIRVSRPVTDGVINLTVKAVNDEERTEWQYARAFDMNEYGYADLPDVAKTALAEGFGKALREATGGLIKQEESEKRIDARIAAWLSGEWGASAEGGEAVAFSTASAEAVSVARAYPDRFETSGAAASFLNAKLNSLLPEPYAKLDEKLRSKARRKFIDEITTKDAGFASAYADEVAARQAAAAARKAARIRAAASGSEGGLFD